MRIKKGDTVEVISGADKGERGQVVQVDPGRNRLKVQGVRKVKRHLRPNAARPRGTIEEREAFFDASNVALIDPETDKPTLVGYREENGAKVRYAKGSGATIPEPPRS